MKRFLLCGSLLVANFLCATPPTTEWTKNKGGDWSSSSNWSHGIPNASTNASFFLYNSPPFFDLQITGSQNMQAKDLSISASTHHKHFTLTSQNSLSLETLTLTNATCVLNTAEATVASTISLSSNAFLQYANNINVNGTILCRILPHYFAKKAYR